MKLQNKKSMETQTMIWILIFIVVLAIIILLILFFKDKIIEKGITEKFNWGEHLLWW